MSNEMESGPLGLAEARRLLNQWSRGGFFRLRDLGSRITIEEITARSSYTVTLQSQYEDRTVEPGFAPYRGEALDDRGEPPHVWDIPVQPPARFEERAERITVPHTDRVESCKSCWGAGRVTCTPCNGLGKVNCPQCQGTGTRHQTETRTQPNAQGVMETISVQVQVPCNCFGGRVNCGQCNGAGRVTCLPCAGAGQVRTFQVAIVHFHCPITSEVIHGSKMPDHLASQAIGEVVIDAQAALALPLPSVTPEVEARMSRLLQQSQTVASDKTRLLFQRLHIEKANMQEIVYRFRSSDTKLLWIYGKDMKVYAPGAPWAWIKLLLILAGVAGVMALIAIFAR
jgi:hypothetical protein